MDPVLRLSGITKTFGNVTAMDHVDLVVPRGALYGVIGPNGAGKTTTIRIILAILLPDAGELTVLGRSSALLAKDRIGYLPEERGVYRKMGVGAFLAYMGKLKGMPSAEANRRASVVLERVGLAPAHGKRCEELSKGMQQRVQFAAAVIHEPELLILDEPFSGLDPVGTKVMRGLILEEHDRGATILLSTHTMHLAEELCQQLVMIHRGRKVLDTPAAAVRRQYDRTEIVFEPLNPGADPAVFTAIPGVVAVTVGDETWRVRLHEGTDGASVMSRMASLCTPARMQLSRLSLEDIFVKIVAGEAPEEIQRRLSAGVASTSIVTR